MEIQLRGKVSRAEISEYFFGEELGGHSLLAKHESSSDILVFTQISSKHAGSTDE